MGWEFFHYRIVFASKSAGSAGPLCVSFEGPQANLRAIGRRAHFISTPDYISTPDHIDSLFVKDNVLNEYDYV